MRLRLAFGVVLVVVAALLAAAPGAWAQGSCSVATLKGAYGLTEQGTVVADVMGASFPVNAPYPSANVAVVTYDGAGHLTATYRASFGGIPFGGPLTGTYTVGPDCTYTDSVPAVGVSRTGVITGEGMSQEVRTILTSTWTVTSGLRQKMPAGKCSSETLKGTYSLHGQGKVGNPMAPPLAPVVQVGTITFDGHGRFEGGETVNANGEGEENTFTGTYTVNPDCSASAEIHSSSGLTLHTAAVIVGEGTRQELRMIVTDPGWVFLATLKRQ
jgi:hypothetical protein